MYISLYENFDRSFKGNQRYTRKRGELIIRDDDTTYFYKNMSRKNLKQFKKDYIECAGMYAKIVGHYPMYSVEYTY